VTGLRGGRIRKVATFRGDLRNLLSPRFCREKRWEYPKERVWKNFGRERRVGGALTEWEFSKRETLVTIDG